MKTYLVLISLLIAGFLNAQPHQCGTIPTQAEIQYLDNTQTQRKSFQLKSLNTNVIQIPIVNHIVRRSNGTGGLTTQQLATAIQNLNTFYTQANVQFFECESTKFINDDSFYDFSSSDDFNLYSSNNTANALNIYYFNSIDGGNICGYTNVPPGPDRVMMANGCTTSGTTLIHEVGHYFSLFHTHGTSNCGTTDELVNGTNCNTRGDRICDTPADPNLRYNPGASDCNASWVDFNCTYTGSFTDANGQQYNPQTNNIMSYSRSACRSIFTQDQFNRVVYSALNDRDYLSCGGTTSPCVSSFPYNESFESGLGAWTQDTGDNIDWTRDASGTPSSSTGPSSASQGTYYMYTESSSPNFPSKIANLVSPCFNLSSINSPTFTFKYHMYGVAMGTLRVQVSTNNGSTWTTLWTKTGNQGNSWQTASVSLNNYTTQTALKLRFNGTTGTSYTSDMAIDDVSLSSGGGGCTLLTNPVSNLSLNSSATNSSVYVYSTSNWTASDNVSWITLNTTSGNGNGNLSFSVTANPSASSRTGTITISCGSSSTTVAITQAGIASSCINLFPYNEGFESGLGAWTQDTGDNIDWTRDASGTPSSSTGPSSASEGTYYMYTESSSPNFPSKIANLVSPCFNLSSINSPTFTFKYHMYGAAMGTLRVQVSTNNGSTWSTIWTKTGNQGNSWQTASVSLNNYTTQTALKLRFNGTTGTSYTSDMAIDDVSLSSGGGGCTLSTNPASNLSLNSSATNSSVYVYSTSNWTASDNVSWITLNTTSGNGNGNLSFSVTANPSASSRTGTITISCGSSSTTVAITQAGVTSSCINLFPYNEGFESGLGAWTQDTGDNIDWTRDASGTPSSSTGPSSASEGTYYMYTESSSPNFPSKIANLVSPCFNLSSISNPTFTFEYHMYGAAMGTLRLQVSTNNGSTWTTLWTKTGNQGNSWQTASVNLNSYTNQTALKVRFNGTTGTSYTSDMAIDDVSLSSGGSGGSCTSLSVSPTTSNRPCNSGGQGINISSDATWTASTNVSWITLTLGNNAPTALWANHTQNTGSTSRTGIVTITCGSITKTVTITQAACSSCPNAVSSFPYLESFESASTLWNPITTSTSCTGTWTKRSGGTPSSGTGPSSAHDGSYYLYTESSSSCNNRTMILEGPCFNLSGVTAANFAFRYHMYGATMGTLYVDASTDGGVSWTNLWSKTGQQNSSNTNPWSSITLSLNGYLNQTVQLRFRGVTGSSYTSDIAIDYLRVITTTIANDTPDSDSHNKVENQTTNVDIRNYPNPFNAQTTIEFTLTEDVPVSLFVSDVTGKQIAVLLDDEQKNKGTHQAIFDGNNYPAGIYYYTIQAGGYLATQKMILVK